jgi:DNA-binding NarL/FixJ family response regulator
MEVTKGMKNTVSGAAVKDPHRTVLLADDHVLVRDGLKLLVASLLGDVRFVEAADGDALFEALHTHPAVSLVLVDVKMPAMHGGHRLLEFALRHPRIPLVVVSTLASPHLARRIMSIPSVFAFVPKSASTDSVRAAINAALAGQKIPLSQPQDRADARPAAGLTPRQRQVCVLLRQGLSNKMIAAELGIGEGTVKNHITDIFRVLNATNRTQAARHLEAE